MSSQRDLSPERISLSTSSQTAVASDLTPSLSNGDRPAVSAEELDTLLKHQDERSVASPTLLDEDNEPLDRVQTKRHDYQRSEGSQTALHPISTSATLRQEKPAWPSELFALRRRISKLQDRISSIQVQLNFDRDAVQPRLESLTDSLAGLLEVLEDARSRSHGGASDTSWADAHDRFITNKRAFEKQMQAVDNKEQHLIRLQYKLAKLERKLLRSVDAYFQPVELVYDRDDDNVSVSSQVEPPPTYLHPLKQQYYDKRGKNRLLQDDYYDLRARAPPPLSERSPSPVSSDDWVKVQHVGLRRSWEAEFETLLQALRVSEMELSDLWAQCRDAYLDVGSLSQELIAPVKDPEMLAEPTEPQRQFANDQDDSRFWPASSDGLVQNLVSPFAESLSRLGKQDMIRHFFRRLPPPGFALTTPQSEPDWLYVERAELDGDTRVPPDDVVITDPSAPDADAVIVPTGGHTAPNGTALSRVVERIRRVKSDSDLRSGLQALSDAATGLWSELQRASS